MFRPHRASHPNLPIAMGLFCLLSAIVHSYTNIVLPVVSDIMSEYHLNEKQVGRFGYVLMISSVSGFFYGYLVDHYHRLRLVNISMIIVVIAALILGMGYDHPFSVLLTLRLIISFFSGVLIPVFFSWVGDILRPTHHSIAAGIFMSSWLLSDIVVEFAEAFFSTRYGWERVFLVLACFNAVVLILFIFFAREPKRLRQKIEGSGTTFWKEYESVFTSLSNWIMIIFTSLISFPLGLIGFFMIPYFETLHISKEVSTMILVLLMLGMAIGAILGGWIGDTLYKRSKYLQPVFFSVIILVSSLAFFLFLTTPFSILSWDRILWALFLGVTLGCSFPNGNAIMMHLNYEQCHGFVFGLQGLISGIALGLGPLFGGIMIQHFGYLRTILLSLAINTVSAIVVLLFAKRIVLDDKTDAAFEVQPEFIL